MIKKIFISIFIAFLVILNTEGYALYNKASGIGTDYRSGLFGLNTTENVEYARNCYKSFGYDTAILTQPTYEWLLRGGYGDYNIRLWESDILYLDGHGSRYTMDWNYKQKGGEYACGVHGRQSDGYESNGYKYVSLNNMEKNTNILVILAGCETASTGDSEPTIYTPNLAQLFYSKGTKNTIGWRYQVESGAQKDFCKHLNWALTQDYTIRDALEYAGAAQTYPEGSNVTSLIQYSNDGGYTKLSDYRVNTYNLEVMKSKAKVENLGYNTTIIKEIPNIRDTNIEFTSGYYEDIFDAISDYDNNFNKDEYSIVENKTMLDEETYTIVLTRKIGEFYTESQYKIFVNNSKVTKIVDSTIYISEEEKNNILSTDIETINTSQYSALATASNVQNYEILNSKISNQRTYYMYNKDGKKQIIVYNTFRYANGTSTVLSEIYDI